MAEQWKAVSPETVTDIAQKLVNLSWPVAADAITPTLESLFGWTPVREDIPAYYTHLGISPGLGRAVKADGNLTRVGLDLVDRDNDESPARNDWIHDVGGSYVLALKEAFGQSRVPPFPRQRDVSFWEMPNRSRLTLTATTQMITLEIESPRLAGAHRTLAKHPDD